MNDLEKWVMNEMIDKMEDMDGLECYLCDLAFELFEAENINGSYDCSSYRAKAWISEYFSELGDVVNEYQSAMGEPTINVFANPEAFQVQIVIFIADRLITTSQFIAEHWDSDEITLDKEIIDVITTEWKSALGGC